MSRARPSRRGSRGVTPRLRAARARPCAAGNARKFSLPPDDAQQLPRDFHRHPERRDDQVCRELHARDPHQSKRPEDVKALIKTAEKNGYKMGLFLQAVTEWKQFRMPSFGVMKKSMKNALIIDGRNIFFIFSA